jgi:hypothetical protein
VSITVNFSGVQAPMTKEQWNQLFLDSGEGSMTYERYEMTFRGGAFNTDVNTDGEVDVETARSRKWIKDGRLCAICFTYHSANGRGNCNE